MSQQLSVVRRRNEAANIQLGQTIGVELEVMQVDPSAELDDSGRPMPSPLDLSEQGTVLTMRLRSPYLRTTEHPAALVGEDNPGNNIVRTEFAAGVFDVPGTWLAQVHAVLPRADLSSSWTDLVVFE